MTKTSDIIERALRKIGVVAEDEPATADQSKNALTALNAMMHGFQARGVNYDHTDIVQTSDFPLPAKLHEAAVYLLAERISADYLRQSPDADWAIRAAQAHYLTVDTARMPIALVSPYRRRGWR